MNNANHIIRNFYETYGTYTEAPKNTILERENDGLTGCYIYYLLSGMCAVNGYSSSGMEYVYYYILPGKLVGINFFLSNSGTLTSYSRPFIQAKTKCALYRISAADFQRCVETDPAFCQYVLKEVAERSTYILAHFKQSREDNAVTGICRFLLDMCDEIPEGMVLSRFFTHDEISHYLGLHIVTVSKIMLKLKTLGLIEKTQKGLLICDPEKLVRMVQTRETFEY